MKAHRTTARHMSARRTKALSPVLARGRGLGERAALAQIEAYGSAKHLPLTPTLSPKLRLGERETCVEAA